MTEPPSTSSKPAGERDPTSGSIRSATRDRSERIGRRARPPGGGATAAAAELKAARRGVPRGVSTSASGASSSRPRAFGYLAQPLRARADRARRHPRPRRSRPRASSRSVADAGACKRARRPSSSRRSSRRGSPRRSRARPARRPRVLDPLEGLTEERGDAGDDYFSVMRGNLAALRRGARMPVARRRARRRLVRLRRGPARARRRRPARRGRASSSRSPARTAAARRRWSGSRSGSSGRDAASGAAVRRAGAPTSRAGRTLGYLRPARAARRRRARRPCARWSSAGRLAAGGLLGPLRRRDRAIVDEAIARVGLDRPAPTRRCGRSRAGLQQRAFIAKALAAEPSLLVLDEPTPASTSRRRRRSPRCSRGCTASSA